jgi:hypothetical protein
MFIVLPFNNYSSVAIKNILSSRLKVNRKLRRQNSSIGKHQKLEGKPRQIGPAGLLKKSFNSGMYVIKIR